MRPSDREGRPRLEGGHDWSRTARNLCNSLRLGTKRQGFGRRCGRLAGSGAGRPRGRPRLVTNRTKSVQFLAVGDQTARNWPPAVTPGAPPKRRTVHSCPAVRHPGGGRGADSGADGTPGYRSEKRTGLVQHHPQDLLHLVEVLLLARERRRELDDRVAAVVGPAVDALVVQRLGQEAAQQLLGLGVVEGLLGVLVLDQLDAVEVPVAADVADDRQVVQPLERGCGRRPGSRGRGRGCPRSRRCRGWPSPTAVDTGCPPKV